MIVAALGLSLSLYLRDTSDATSESRAPPTAPRFSASWHRSVLNIDGHTISVAHEQELLDVAGSSFPQVNLQTRFETRGLLPEHWHDTTIRALSALAASVSGSVELQGDQLIIESVAVDAVDWQTRLQILEDSLATDVTVSASTFTLAEVDVAALCQNAFDSFESGAVNFEESTNRLRSSAYPRLDRVADLADACRDSAVAITGHTDSSGPESHNQRLSQQRAAAVANYLENTGIDRHRLITGGAGSSSPIANNATRYGRSLNRRIEIGFAATDPARSAE